MNCLSPIPRWIHPLATSKNGRKKLISENPFIGDRPPDIFLPCGRCVLCRHEKFKRWIRRLQTEAIDNVSTFLTLTYNDNNLEDCNKYAIQCFLKRFRQLSRKGLDLSRFKYFFVSEYGRKSRRPHYHAILFGVDILRNPFFDSYVATSKRDKRGRVYPVFSSRLLESVWDKGFNSVDRCTSANIKYVAKYVAKSKASDRRDNLFYLFSRRIGTSLFLSGDYLTPFARRVFASNRFLLERDSFPSAAPKFLDYYFRLHDEPFYDSVKAARAAFASRYKISPERLKGLAFSADSMLKAYERDEIL